MSGLHVGNNYDATVTASGNVFVVVDPQSAMVEEVSAEGGSRMLCKPIIKRRNKIIVRQVGCTSNSTSLRAMKSEELEIQDLGEEAPSGSSKAPSKSGVLTFSQQALVPTSRLVFNDLKNSPNFCGVGLTFGYDLSLGQKLTIREEDDEISHTPRIIRILLGACGDIRNLLKTASSLQQCPLHVVLNDWNVAILARDIVLLSLIAQHTSAADVLAIWANHALTSLQREQLNSVLKNLAVKLPDWLVCSEEPGSNLATELLDAFAAWRDCTMTLQELDSLRAQELTEFHKDMVIDFIRDAIGPIHADKQIKQHISTGNVKRTRAMKSSNSLLLEAPGLQYTLPWACSIYRAIKLEESDSTGSWPSALGLDSAGSEGLYELLLQTITPQVNAVAYLFEQGALRVGVIDGNILEGMLFGGCLRLLHQLGRHSHHPSTSTSPLFDFVDLSNTSDFLSMPAMVQAGLPLLKAEKHSILHAESFTWHINFNTRDPRQFLKCAIGMDLDVYQELLGVSVQTQIVGSFKPLLQTRWTWDLRASQEPRLTGAAALFEIMTAAKLHCAIDRAKYISSFGIRLNDTEVFGGFVAGIDCSSPLTMLHLLYLCCPGIALPVVRALVAANDTSNTRKWELMGHAMFQQDPVASQKMFVKVVFQAKVYFTTLCACPEAPLCLIVSKAPVTVTWVPVDVVTDVVQWLEAFSYSIESDLVEVLLSQSLLDDSECQSYFITLCALTDGIKLQAVSSSIPWSELTAEPLTAPLPSWKKCEAIAKRALLSNDLELLELMAKLRTSENDGIPAQSWKTHAVLETHRFVIVELLLPRPLPGPEEVALSVTSSGASLKVAAKAVIKKEKDVKVMAETKGEEDSTCQKDAMFPDQEHIIELPAAISSGGHSTKVSRKLGIMIVRLPKVV